MLTSFTQIIINILGALGSTVIMLLPLSPFLYFNAIMLDNQLLRFLAWIVPIPQIIILLQTWVSAVTVFYISKVILRWVKIVS